MIFLGLVLVPVARLPKFQKYKDQLIRLTGERFRQVGWFALGTLVVTGTFNVIYRVGWEDLWNGDVWATGFGITLAHKVMVVGIIIIVSAIHDFALGPKAARELEADPEGEEAEKYRRRASWMGRLNLILGIIVVFLAIMLVRGGL